jgi:hypothetical protein
MPCLVRSPVQLASNSARARIARMRAAGRKKRGSSEAARVRTFRTWRDVRLKSVMRSKDGVIGRPNLWIAEDFASVNSRPRQAEPAAIGRHAVLRPRQDRWRHRTNDGDAGRPRRRSAVVDHARSEARVDFRVRCDHPRGAARRLATPRRNRALAAAACLRHVPLA